MADDGWDDLFAKASGQQNVAVESSQVSRKEEPRRKKRKRLKTKVTKNHHASLLEGRMRIPSSATWPQWMNLKGSLSNQYNCWQGAEYAKCRICGKNALHHKLCANALAQWPIQVFCLLRNLRCIGVLLAMGDSQVDEVTTSARSESSELFRTLKINKSSLQACGEDEVFEQKCKAVVDAVNNVLGRKHDCFGEAIRVIIACDDLYYRLYYLQISRVLQQDDVQIPHPAGYFHLPFLAWVGTENALEDWRDFVDYTLSGASDDDGKQERLRNEIASRYSVHLLPPRMEDVLTLLHHNRTMETARLFYTTGWMSRKGAVKQMKSALQEPPPRDGLECHETPAPGILSEWRDICRDRLCNLYAYATLSNESIQRIKKNLENNGISGGVVEIGAGSGYLAALLQRAGISVVSWDLHPPGNSKLNEYHGHTPAFCEVNKGSPSDLCRHADTARKAALLLCYPPPESPMAKEALETYLNVGGQCLVHVGELGGLTGSPAFEKLLVQSCHCVDRFSCLSWGTDAAEVSIWMRADGKHVTHEQSLLVPCSNCGKVEASRRCRLVRHVAYCGKKCCLQHSSSLTVHLAINMIPLKATKLEFDNDCHFLPIQTGKPTGAKSEARG